MSAGIHSHALCIALSALLPLVGLCCTSFGTEPAPGSTSDSGAIESGSADGRLARERKLVFVPSPETSAVVDADGMCNQAARARQLSGEFVAWRSSTSSLALARLGPDEQREWYDGRDRLVAQGKSALVRGGLSIEVDEAGNLVDFEENVWTGTLADGGSSPDNCEDWTSNDKESVGLTGEIGKPGGGWTESTARDCSQQAHLYCFEK